MHSRYRLHTRFTTPPMSIVAFALVFMGFCKISADDTTALNENNAPLFTPAAPDEFFVLRGDLNNCRIRFERDKVGRVVFLGGSITHNSGWRDMTCEYLRKRFPETKFEFINAGIPSTGSVPGAFRLLRDVFGTDGTDGEVKQVDLLFEEAAVNDSSNGRSAEQMTRGMEGIVRHARKLNPQIDVVVMHFVDPSKIDDYRAGRTPVVVQQHEAVAKHYDTTSIHLAREVQMRIDAGEFTWEKDFRNLHPSPFGQKLYAATIARMLDKAWSKPLAANVASVDHPLPRPIDPQSYDSAELRPISSATDLAGFTLVDNCDPRKPSGGGVRPGFVNVPMLSARSRATASRLTSKVARSASSSLPVEMRV